MKTNNEKEINEKVQTQGEKDDISEDVHLSVSFLQRNDDIKIEKKEEIDFICTLCDNETCMNNPNAYNQIEEVNQVYKKSFPKEKRNEFLPWPSVSSEAENEFNGIKIFTNTFPLLFSGGMEI